MTDDKATTPNPFSRPGFIAGAAVVVALVLAAGVLTVLNLTRGNDAAPDPLSSASIGAAPTPPSDGGVGGASVCDLDGVKLGGTVSTAPAAEWRYQDVYAYPVSPSAGPGKTAPEGYRYCYQHTPEGAVFAAANITVAGFGPVDLRVALLDYALSDGPYREGILDASAGGSSGDTQLRSSIAGFRLLEYTGDVARVDIAFRATTSGQTVVGSVVCELVWKAGDWRLDADKSEPVRIAQLPDVSGYTSWTVG